MTKYRNICFVIMPFGEKEVLDDTGASRKVNFDPIYEKVFAPAVRATRLPEGGNLEPRRTDKDFFTSVITQDMFEYLGTRVSRSPTSPASIRTCSTNSASGIGHARPAR